MPKLFIQKEVHRQDFGYVSLGHPRSLESLGFKNMFLGRYSFPKQILFHDFSKKRAGRIAWCPFVWQDKQSLEKRLKQSQEVDGARFEPLKRFLGGHR